MSTKRIVLRPCAVALGIALALGLAGCGGGGGSNVRPTSPPPSSGSGGGSDDIILETDDTITRSDDISGEGGLIKDGTGTAVLTGTNTYTGGTTINDGILQLGDGGTSGSIIGDVTNNGSLVFNRSDDVTFDGIVSGSGSLVQAGKRMLVLTDANTYTGGTTISDGSLQIGEGGKSGSITGNVKNNGSLVFNRSDDVTFDGIVSGTGSLVQASKGMLILTDANTYTGGTTINGGSLRIGEGGKSGSITGNVKNKGSLVFNRSDDLSFGGIVSGTGSLVQAGKGTLTLTGANTYTGGTTISDGALQIGDGGKAGSITGDVTNNGWLAFNRADDMGFAGTVTGTGGLTKGGDGVLILTGANGYNGVTRVISGSMYVDGDQSAATGATTVANGAILGGMGTIGGDVNLADGAFLAPGSNDAIGTLTINGDLDLSAGSTLDYSFGQANTAGGQTNDLTNVNGKLVLDGSLNVSVASGGNFGPGLYRLFNYAGTLVDNGLVLGPSSPSGLVIQTGVTQQVNLINTQGMIYSFWDGDAGPKGNDAIDGGNGVWERGNSLTSNNWTDASGAVNASFSDSSFAVFQDSPGTVTVDAGNGAVNVSGMQFASDGYVVQGDAIHLSGGEDDPAHSIIRVGDGTSVGADFKAIINSVLDGDSTLIKAGVGTLVLGGANTYAGGTKVNGGSLEITSDGALGTGTVTVDNSANIDAILKVDSGVSFSNSVVLNNGAVLDNAGAITGAMDSEAVTSDTGAVTILNRDGGSIEGIGLSGIAVNLHHGGTIRNGVGSMIGGNRAIVVTGGDMVNIVNDGGKIIGHGSDALFIAATSITVTNSNGGTIDGNYDGMLLWARSTVRNESGSTIRSLGLDGKYAVELLSGGTLVNAGTIIGDVRMGLKSTTVNFVTLTAGGSIQGDLFMGTQAQSTLTLNGNSLEPQSYSDAVTGMTTFTGTLIKDGSGTWIIDSNDLSSVVETNVNDGVLQAISTLSGNVNVAVAGVLDGVPDVAGYLVNAGKVAVRGGDSVVGGFYSQASTGSLAVSLGSKLDVAGTATLNGGTLEVTGADDGYVANTHTQVLTAAGGVSGAFDELVKDTGVVFTATTINYGANEVWLDTTGLDVTTAAAGGGVYYTPASMGSARRVQGAFEQLDTKVADGSLDTVSNGFVRAAGQFQQSPNLRAAQASLESLSGQLHASSAAMTLQTIDATGRALSDRLEKLSAQEGNRPQGVWMSSLCLDGDMTRSGYGDVSYRLNGWLVGQDLRLGAHSLVGFAFSQGHGVEQLSGRFDRNHSRNTSGMAYAGWADHDWYAHARVGMGHYRQNIDRMLLLGTSYQGVWTEYGGNYHVAYGESGRHFALGSAQLTPFVDLQYARVTRDGFAERGGGGFGLKANDRTLQRWQSGVGLKLSRQWQFTGGRSLSLDARAQWLRTLSANGAAFDASFTGLDEWRPLTGVGLSRRSAVFGVDLQAVPSANTRFKLGYQYLTGSRGRAGAASAHFSLLF